MALEEFKNLSIKKKIEKTIFIIQKTQFLIINFDKTNKYFFNNKNNSYKIISFNEYNNNQNIDNKLIEINNILREFWKLEIYLNFILLSHPKLKDTIDIFFKTNFYNALSKYKIGNNSSNKIKDKNIFEDNYKKNSNEIILSNSDKDNIVKEIIKHKNLYVEELQKFIYFLKDIAKIEKFKNDFDRINKSFFDKFLNKNISGKFSFEVLCADIRSPFNVGSIIRSAESFGFKKVWLYGISSNLDLKKIFKTSKMAENFIKIEKANYNKLLNLKNEGNWDFVVGLETFDNAVSIDKIQLTMFGKNNLIVIGNEEFGISEKLIPVIDFFITIPMVGNKNSINVANAFSVVSYKLLELLIKNKNNKP